MSILEKISLTRKEKKQIDKNVKSFLKELKNNEIKFFPGGSYAKDTLLKGDIDIDIFARFKYNKYVSRDISKELKKFLKAKFKKIKILHGSRDYFQVKYLGLNFEIVPVLKIRKSSQAINIMDVSPLHVKFVKKRTNKRLQNDIKLLKQLCKANDLYGAESYIRGFSGYVLELLIIYYRSFDNLIKNAREWGKKEVIHFGRDKEKALSDLSKSKKTSPLILIDPVQESRNASAALSKKNYEKFISLCRTYNGNKSFFIKKEILLEKLKDYVIFKIRPLEGKRDIIGAKLLSLLERMKKEFEMKDFKIKNYGWKFEDYAYFWFKSDKIDKKKIHFGPRLKDKKHLELFKRKWKNKVKVHKGRTYVILKRKFVDPIEFAKFLRKENWLKERVKSISIYKN